MNRSSQPNVAQYLVPLHTLKGGIIIRWLIATGSEVKEEQAILEYRDIQRLITQTLRAPVSGWIHYESGEKFQNSTTLCTIDVCLHSVLFAGSLCAHCGHNIEKQPRNTYEFVKAAVAKVAESKSSASGTANLPTSSLYKVQHGFEIALSDAHVEAADAALAARLHTLRRLTLILDLDHTLLHATNDTRVGAALADTASSSLLSSDAHVPAAASVSNRADRTTRASSYDICIFTDESFGLDRNTTSVTEYFVKLRPHVRDFLQQASQLFELQVDTAGTRAYAQKILTYLDPNGAFFGNRLVSRCDSRIRHKQTSWLHRSLKDDSMVLIVDDTEVVWRGSRNLLLIEPYVYWLSNQDVNNHEGGSVTAVTGDGAVGTNQSQPNSLDESSTAPPLVDSEASPLQGSVTGNSDDADPSKTVVPGSDSLPTHRLEPALAKEEQHAYLLDVLEVLRSVHKHYYEQYDSYEKSRITNNIANDTVDGNNLSGNTATPAIVTGLGLPMPRTDSILRDILRNILADVCICFSGVFPLGATAFKSPLWRRCVAFGATMTDSISSEISSSHPPTTHLVVRRIGTAKFAKALAVKNIRIVALSWLEETLKRYARQPESEHSLPFHASAAIVDNSERVAALHAYKTSLAQAAAHPPMPITSQQSMIGQNNTNNEHTVGEANLDPNETNDTDPGRDSKRRKYHIDSVTTREELMDRLDNENQLKSSNDETDDESDSDRFAAELEAAWN